MAGKHYVKPKNKKYFTKKDVIAVCVAAVVIIAAVIVLALVINRDAFIRTKDGKLQIPKNMIVADYGASSNLFYEIGTVSEVSGYTLSDESEYSVIKVFKPDDEESKIDAVYIGASKNGYQELAKSMSEYAATKYSIDTPDVKDITLASRSAEYFSYALPEDAEAEEGAGAFVATAYISYDDTHSTYIQISSSDVNMTQEDVESLLALFGDSLKLEEKK